MGRKLSCIPCRSRKVKCDGNSPCSRCRQRQCEFECAYKTPGMVGRPPKNARINKLALATMTSSCQEFVFESTPSIPLRSNYLCQPELELRFYLDHIFTNGMMSSMILFSNQKDNQTIRSIMQIRLFDLNQQFVASIADHLNIFLHRSSRLPLNHYTELDFINTSLTFDQSSQFFDSSCIADEAIMTNPLLSLPTQQAIHMIHTFFAIDPYSCIASEADIVERYWSDALDPLLLSVILGTTIYKSRILEGEPVRLWHASTKTNRNTFLDYAHALLYHTSADLSVDKYQAMVLLSVFEITYGFPRRGMALIGVSSLLGKTLFEKYQNIAPHRRDPLENERLIATYWAAKQHILRGSMEIGFIPSVAFYRLPISLPCHSTRISALSQYDHEKGYRQLNDSIRQHATETFFSHCVIVEYSCRILTALAPGLTDKHGKKPSSLPDCLVKVAQVITELDHFVNLHQLSWSPLVCYILNTFIYLCKIHLAFFRIDISWTVQGDRMHVEGDPLGNVVVNDEQLFDNAFYTIDEALELTQRILESPSDYVPSKVWLPLGIIMSLIESVMRVAMRKVTRDPWDDKAYQTLMTITSMVTSGSWADEWACVRFIHGCLVEFFRLHPLQDRDDQELSVCMSSKTPSEGLQTPTLEHLLELDKPMPFVTPFYLPISGDIADAIPAKTRGLIPWETDTELSGLVIDDTTLPSSCSNAEENAWIEELFAGDEDDSISKLVP